MKRRQRGYMQKPRSQNVRVWGTETCSLSHCQLAIGCTVIGRWERTQEKQLGAWSWMALVSHVRSLRRKMGSLWKVFSRRGTEFVVPLSISIFPHWRAVVFKGVPRRNISGPWGHLWLLSYPIIQPSMKTISSTFKNIFGNEWLLSLFSLL